MVSISLVVIIGRVVGMDSEYLEYAKDVLSGDISACRWVKLACKRFLDDIDSGNCYVDENKYKTINTFLSVLKHYSSGAAGKSFILEPWQKFLVTNIFCLYRSDNHKRKYTQAHISVARKNGKTSLAAVLGLFALIADGEPAASIIMAANSREQAKIDFDAASAWARQLDPKRKFLKVLRNEIVFQKTNSKLKVIAADATKLDGSNDSFIVVDELHEAPDGKLYDVLRSGQGFRQQPMIMSITTAGFRIGGFCNQLEDYCKEVLQGIKQDDSLFALLYTLDEGDDWTNSSVYVKSNPNLGITVNEDWLLSQVNQAKNSPTLEVGVKTKNLNLWVNSSNVWIPEHIVNASLIDINLNDLIGNDNYIVYMGFDLAAVSDLTCLTLLFIDTVKEEYLFKNIYYLPKSALEGKYNSELYKYWAGKGYLKITDSNTTDYNYIKNDIRHYYDVFNVLNIFYDAWNATSLVNDLTNEGLPLKPFSQSIGHFNRPTKEYERLMLNGNVKLDRNPINRFCHDNVTLKIDQNGNCKPVGDHEKRKIDGVISQINALGGYLEETNGWDYSALVLPYNS